MWYTNLVMLSWKRVAGLVCALILGLHSGSCARERSDATPRGAGPVILISIDTLRADHLPVYGATSVETPAIDALANDSIVFENAYSHVPLTLPSHVTILTGLLPEQTGVRNNLGYRFDGAAHPTIPSLLKAKGYATGAAVSAYVLRGATGLGPLFDDYDDRIDPSSEGGAMGDVQRSGDATIAAAIPWITAKKDQPFFYFVHLFEPHAPYAPPEPFRSRYADRPYDGEIAATDAIVGRFLDALKGSGIYDRATIILLSDHGEGLGDHGESQHGIFLYREAIHVPLLVKLPRAEMKGQRVAAPVQLADVLPTIASITGFKVPEAAKGVSLVEVARGHAPSDRRVFSETMYPRIHLGWSNLASLVDATHHYIDAPRPELYDVKADVTETRNILGEERRVYASMRAEVESHDRSLDPPKNVDPEEAAKLAALGYLGSSSAAASGGELPDPKDHIADLELTAQATTLVNKGSYTEAVAILRDVVRRNPSFADAWTMLAKALDGAGRSDEAIEAYRKTLEVAPMLAPGTAMSLADLYMRAGKFDAAIQHAEIALSSHPSAARLLIAEAHLGKRDFASAERAIAAVAEDPGKRNEATVVLAQVRIGQKRFDEAMRLLDGIKGGADGAPTNYWFARGDALARMNRIPDAMHAFAEEIRLYPKNREAYVRLAALQVLSGREPDARKTFDLMLRHNPGPSSRALVEDTFRALRR